MKQITTCLLAITLALIGLVVLLQTNANTHYDVIVTYSKPMKVDTQKAETSVSLESFTDHHLINETLIDSQEGIQGVIFPLELNSATIEELEQIPQIGNVMAQRIVQYREVLGAYDTLEQLQEIKGIGKKTFTEISAYLYLEE